MLFVKLRKIKMLEQIKHYLDWPLQLYALQEADFSLQDELRKSIISSTHYS